MIENWDKKAKRKRIREQSRMENNTLDFCEEQNDTFYYTDGYTSGGAPYGVTWEEIGLQYDIGEFDNKG